MAEGRPAIDLAASGRFSGAVQIRDARLISSFFSSETAELDVEGFHTEFFAEVSGLDEKSLLVTVSFRLADHREGHDGHADDEEAESSPELTAFADFEISYDILKAVDPADADSFAWINGVMNAWSYWRTLTHNMLMSMGHPAVIVPVFRVENEALGRPAVSADASPSTDKPPAAKKRAPAKKVAKAAK